LSICYGKANTRAWKGHDWDALGRLFEKGYICDPKGKAKSVVLTEEGSEKSRELFHQQFGLGEGDVVRLKEQDKSPY